MPTKTLRLLRLLWLSVRRILQYAWRFSWWTTAGLRDARIRPKGLRLLGLGLAIGFLVGWANSEVIHVFTDRGSMPKPVTPPPPGMAWARVLTTGYCPCTSCCGPNAIGRTAINNDVRAHPYGIAADKGLMPYRTSLYVPGYGIADVDDTGGAMRQDARRGRFHLDLRFTDHAQARRWGVRWMWIAVPAGVGAASLPESR